jgi:hypothetical protein
VHPPTITANLQAFVHQRWRSRLQSMAKKRLMPLRYVPGRPSIAATGSSRCARTRGRRTLIQAAANSIARGNHNRAQIGDSGRVLQSS